MRKTQLNKTQKTAVVGGTVLALAVGGVAFAAWTSTGSGTGNVSAGQAVNLQVNGVSASGLYPTVTVPQSVEIKNPNPYDVKLSSLQFDGASTTTSGCDASTVTAANLTGLTDVAQKNNGNTVTKTVQVTMSNAATNACQGATFVLSYTANGASN